MPRLIFTIFLLLLALGVRAGERLDPKLRAALQSSERVEVLIHLSGNNPKLAELRDARFEDKVSAAGSRLRQSASESQSGLLALLRQRGAEHQAFWIVNAVWARVDGKTLTALSALPEVIEISGNPTLSQRLPPAMPTSQKAITAVEWGVQRVNAPALWAQGFRGQGVVIAGQDTGYQWNHPALQKAYLGWDGSSANHNYAWHDAIGTLLSPGSNICGLNATAPCDDNNHGTHTMGTMVGDDAGANQTGVAPDARWIGCRNMERGNGRPTTYLECLQWFLAPTDLAGNNPDPSKAPHIINNSWGCPPSELCETVGVLEEAVNNLRAAGILVVVSAGNSGSGCGSIDTAPAPYDASFTVGATDISDAIAGFSSRGPASVDGVSLILKPDISGPGVSVRSSTRGGGYGISNGTSMAGPHVAGVAALLMSADPSLRGQPERVETLMRASARPRTSAQNCGDFLGSTVPNAVFGHGIVDAQRAIDLLGIGFRNGFEEQP